TAIVLSPRFETNSVLPSGVSAAAVGCGPVDTLDRTDDTAPLLKSIVKELTNWSPLVATHMNPVPDVVPLFAVEQLLTTITGITASSARTHERMRILVPLKFMLLGLKPLAGLENRRLWQRAKG